MSVPGDLAARARQFREASRLPSDADLALALKLLEPPLLALFEGQHPRDIVHSAGTARWLLERGHDDRDLLLAALLHDVAKGDQRRRDRVAYVVTSSLGAAEVVGSERSRLRMRRAIARSLGHAASGAELLYKVGAPQRVIALTRLHHLPAAPHDPVLALLQIADAAN